MAALGKGDWVQCIDPRWRGTDFDGGVICGGVYCVDFFHAEPPEEACCYCGNADPGFELVGVEADGESAWCHCQFKPLGGGHDSRSRYLTSQRANAGMVHSVHLHQSAPRFGNSPREGQVGARERGRRYEFQDYVLPSGSVLHRCPAPSDLRPA